MEKTVEKNLERTMEKSMERNIEKIVERNMEKEEERIESLERWKRKQERKEEDQSSKQEEKMMRTIANLKSDVCFFSFLFKFCCFHTYTNLKVDLQIQKALREKELSMQSLAKDVAHGLEDAENAFRNIRGLLSHFVKNLNLGSL